MAAGTSGNNIRVLVVTEFIETPSSRGVERTRDLTRYSRTKRHLNMGCGGSTQAAGDATSTQYDHLFKLVLVGEVGAGKSSLVLRYTDDTFLGDEVGTIGADFKVKFITVQKKRVKMQIWDTAGQEKFRTMTSSYFAGANAVIVVFDLTDKKSFDLSEKWIREAKKFNGASNPISFLLVGNKSDLPNRIEGVTEKAKAFASQHGAIYCETSAKTGAKVADAFFAIGEKLKKEVDGESKLD